jgi:hypothetical protein
MRCDVCENDAPPFGQVCQHLVHGQLLTYNTSARDTDEIPDTACTSCYFRYHEKGDVPDVWEQMRLHTVCARCHDAIMTRNVLPGAHEQWRGYALVSAPQYAAAHPEWRPPRQALRNGDHVKVGFSPIPSRAPVSIEKMWLRITGTTNDGAFIGVLDNDPRHFAPDVLRCGDEVAFQGQSVLDVLRDDTRGPECASERSDP